MRWRLLCEEYGPKLIYIKGPENIVADTLSRLALPPSNKSECNPDVKDYPSSRKLAEAFASEDASPIDPSIHFPLRLTDIRWHQRQDRKLIERAKKDDKYRLSAFHGGGARQAHGIITRDDLIVVPRSLENRLITWYHETLCHPGATRMELTIKQHFYVNNLQEKCKTLCRTCDACQRNKPKKIKYGHLPPKQAERDPWKTLCVDMIGPYKIMNHGKILQLWAVTMIDPVTGWFEIAEANGTKQADEVANIVELHWLNRYPWPQQIVCDRGTEFKAEFAEMIEKEYGFKKKMITSRNPQSNAIVERAHQTIGNMLKVMELQHQDLSDGFRGIIGAVAFALRATVSTTTRATPMQLVFGRDAILPIKHLADWRYITERKQTIINENNKRENKRRKSHEYKVGDKVLITLKPKTKYGSDTHLGPVKILEVNNNGTVKVKLGVATDIYNIRQITPYHTL